MTGAAAGGEVPIGLSLRRRPGQSFTKPEVIYKPPAGPPKVRPA